MQNDIEAAKAQTHWTAKQRNHLRRLQKQGALICYWCSDAHGMPANMDLNYDKKLDWIARPGLVQTVEGPLTPCSSRSLHGTLEPHKWKGSRVWIVGLVGAVQKGDNKFAALHREIIGEVLPHEAIDPSVAARVGRLDLQGEDLRYAYFEGMHFRKANLSNSILTDSNWMMSTCIASELENVDLRWSFLRGANFEYSKLPRAKLSNSHLSRANFQGCEMDEAILQDSNLDYASFAYAKLRDADLRFCSARKVDFYRADLRGVNFSGCFFAEVSFYSCNLQGANFTSSNIKGVDFSGANVEGINLKDVQGLENAIGLNK